MIVDGVNVAKKHQKARSATMQGGIIDKDMPIPVANVALLCPERGKPTRVGYRSSSDGTKVRICRRTRSGDLMATATTRPPAPRLKQRYDDDDPGPAQGRSSASATSWRSRGSRRSWSTWASATPSGSPRCSTAPCADLTLITGQKPAVTRAKKSIATFKLREGNAIGAKVTLRGDRMWEFFDRLVSLAIPRIRDFRGLNPQSFDGNGNYTFGVTEQLIFPEIDYDKIDTTRGMDITIVTTARTDAEGRALLAAFGFPFKREGQQ